ncbi:porin family protein [Paracoccus sp. Z118]|uniref:outer membrane protein n=1 Tax=Paracoccus sp. Z118 TaxID=2851017 RepID=UPI001C2C0186|nr:porin family protein [Paracoccus sp. Z118]MBV0890737.1 porin family protein [Paracoccus sp. Z118]
MRKMTIPLASAIALGLAASANAGGYTAPVTDVAPAAPVVVTPAPAGDWQGLYAGGTLGYGFGGDDEFTLGGGSIVGDNEISGVNAGLHVGYRWQRGNLVIGPELSITGGNVDDSVSVLGDDYESSLNHMVALKLKTGYQVRPDTLVYGIAGVSRGDFTFTADGQDFDYDTNGYVFGLGIERMITDRLSVTGEIERNHFKSENIDLGALGDTNGTPTFNNVKVGVNFKF